MTIELYWFEPSPPCRCSYMVLKALGLDCVKKPINLLTKEHKKEDFTRLNPRQKVPCIKDGDFIIAESRAISAYLCNRYEGEGVTESLYPRDPLGRGIVDQLLYVSENVTDMIQEYVNFVGVVFAGEEVKAENIGVARRALGFIEAYLADKDFVAANHLTIADIHMSSPLTMLELTGFNFAVEFPKTGAWFDRIRALPYWEECNGAGLVFMTEMFTSRGKSFSDVTENKE